MAGGASGSIDERLRFAIAHKHLIGIAYHGRLRVAEPHDYGFMKGRARLLVYQLSAADHGGDKPVRGWRLLDVGRIEACEVSQLTFAGSRGRSHHRHMTWDAVFARVE